MTLAYATGRRPAETRRHHRSPGQGRLHPLWLKNKSIDTSDHRRVYTFDSDAKHMEGLKVFVHAATGDVLVLEITRIEYNIDLDPKLFTLELPKNVAWFVPPRGWRTIETERMTRKKRPALFQACRGELGRGPEILACLVP